MKKIIGLFSAVLLLLFVTGSAVKTEKNSTQAKVLKAAPAFKSVVKKGITLKWLVEKEKATFIVSAPCKGWVAVGFNPSYMMQDANYLMGYVGEKGKVFVSDAFGTGPKAHKPDKELGGKDNIMKYSGKEDAAATEISFTIPLNSLEKYDTVLKPGNKIFILLAYANTDDFTTRHAERTQVTIEL